MGLAMGLQFNRRLTVLNLAGCGLKDAGLATLDRVLEQVCRILSLQLPYFMLASTSPRASSSCFSTHMIILAQPPSNRQPGRSQPSWRPFDMPCYVTPFLPSRMWCYPAWT